MHEKPQGPCWLAFMTKEENKVENIWLHQYELNVWSGSKYVCRCVQLQAQTTLLASEIWTWGCLGNIRKSSDSRLLSGCFHLFISYENGSLFALLIFKFYFYLITLLLNVIINVYKMIQCTLFASNPLLTEQILFTSSNCVLPYFSLLSFNLNIQINYWFFYWK